MPTRLSLVAALILCLSNASLAQNPDPEWHFAVSGDSRNCGDVVMPAIAKSVKANNSEFYWHLGDFRWGSDIDEDFAKSFPAQQLAEYRKNAWDDFIAQQVEPFAPVTVHLGIGNHELYFHGRTKQDESLSHEDFVRKFSKFLAGSKTAYYQWRLHHIDFINLDNSFNEGFDPAQMSWLENFLKQDSSDSDVSAIVVGMHRALPNSLACGHSMNGDATAPAEDNRKSTESGRKAYQDLWDFQNATHKVVYVLSSHSHLYMENIFNSPYWNDRTEKDPALLKGGSAQKPLQGWLVGTAGARRYRLPDNLPPNSPALTYAYGYLLATVKADHSITFQFIQLTEDDLLKNSKYDKTFVHYCYLANRDDAPHPPESSCNEQ
jgi:hypothetical protein